MKRDIFDRIMELPGLRLFNGVYKRNKSILLYLFFGGITTLISIVSFVSLYAFFKINELIANIISWVCAVLFAYFTNRTWVFQSTAKGKTQIQEMTSFCAGRLMTLGIEEIILFIFITILSFDGTVVKIGAQVAVLILNYVISKCFVFRGDK